MPHVATVEGFLLIADVERGAHAFAAISQPDRRHRGATMIVVHRRVAFAVQQVHARAKLVVIAKTTAQIQRSANLRLAGIIHADTG